MMVADTGRAACASQRGAKSNNEDAAFAYDYGKFRVAAVFDGHGGKNGMLAANVGKDVTARYFEKVRDSCVEWSEDVWKSKMEDFFLHCHDSIRCAFVEQLASDSEGGHEVDDKGVVRRPNGFPVHGGTTATLCVVVDLCDEEGSLVICANVGDSDGILVTGDELSSLTTDHGPDSSAEFLRIKNLDSNMFPTKLLFVYDDPTKFRKHECPLVFEDSGEKVTLYTKDPWGHGLRPTNVRYDPAVYAISPVGISKDMTCIAMTRSLGDFYAHPFGLTCSPSVNIRRVPPQQRFSIILGSDGVWDCWHFKEFTTLVTTHIAKSASLQTAVDVALTISVAKSKSSFGPESFDDSSLSVLLSHPFAST